MEKGRFARLAVCNLTVKVKCVDRNIHMKQSPHLLNHPCFHMHHTPPSPTVVRIGLVVPAEQLTPQIRTPLRIVTQPELPC